MRTRKSFSCVVSILAGVCFALVVMISSQGFQAQSGFTLTSPLSKLNIGSTPAKIAITNGQGAQTNQTYVSVSFRDNSNNLVKSVPFTMWLSDSAVCAGLTATTASGTADIIGTTGANFGALTAKKAFSLQSSALGVAQLGIIDSAKTAFVPCVFTPWAGTVVGPTLATGNYK